MEYEEKFIVINKKHLKELDENTRYSNCNCREANCPHELMFPPLCKEIKALNKALKKITKAYENRVGKKLNQKYYVVNQDEPYAKEILNILTHGEDAKIAN